jgi:hypothetical protein
MKIQLIVAMFLVPASTFARPVTVTVAQCRNVLKDFAAVRTDAAFNSLTAAMTSGDEMTLSTRLRSCVDQHSDVLTGVEIAALNLIVYKLDADVMGRMWNFIDKRGLGDAFNDEQEANKAK